MSIEKVNRWMRGHCQAIPEEYFGGKITSLIGFESRAGGRLAEEAKIRISDPRMNDFQSGLHVALGRYRVADVFHNKGKM